MFCVRNEKGADQREAVQKDRSRKHSPGQPDPLAFFTLDLGQEKRQRGTPKLLFRKIILSQQTRLESRKEPLQIGGILGVLRSVFAS